MLIVFSGLICTLCAYNIVCALDHIPVECVSLSVECMSVECVSEEWLSVGHMPVECVSVGVALLFQSASSELKIPSIDRLHVSSSNPNLLCHDADRPRPSSMPDNWLTGGVDPRLQEMKLREDFISNAKSGESERGAIHDRPSGLHRRRVSMVVIFTHDRHAL